jgi:hypothetical protein
MSAFALVLSSAVATHTLSQLLLRSADFNLALSFVTFHLVVLFPNFRVPHAGFLLRDIRFAI